MPEHIGNASESDRPQFANVVEATKWMITKFDRHAVVFAAHLPADGEMQRDTGTTERRNSRKELFGNIMWFMSGGNLFTTAQISFKPRYIPSQLQESLERALASSSCPTTEIPTKAQKEAHKIVGGLLEFCFRRIHQANEGHPAAEGIVNETRKRYKGNQGQS